MSAIGFLLIALVVAGIGFLIIWVQHRSPSTLESGIDAFQREMSALAPPDEPDHTPPDESD